MIVEFLSERESSGDSISTLKLIVKSITQAVVYDKDAQYKLGSDIFIVDFLNGARIDSVPTVKKQSSAYLHWAC